MYGIDIELGDYHIGSSEIADTGSGYYEGWACAINERGEYGPEECRTVSGRRMAEELVLFVGNEVLARDAITSDTYSEYGKLYFLDPVADSLQDGKVSEYANAFEAIELVPIQGVEGEMGMEFIMPPAKAHVRFFTPQAPAEIQEKPAEAQPVDTTDILVTSEAVSPKLEESTDETLKEAKKPEGDSDQKSLEAEAKPSEDGGALDLDAAGRAALGQESEAGQALPESSVQETSVAADVLKSGGPEISSTPKTAAALEEPTIEGAESVQETGEPAASAVTEGLAEKTLETAPSTVVPGAQKPTSPDSGPGDLEKQASVENVLGTPEDNSEQPGPEALAKPTEDAGALALGAAGTAALGQESEADQALPESSVQETSVAADGLKSSGPEISSTPKTTAPLEDPTVEGEKSTQEPGEPAVSAVTEGPVENKLETAPSEVSAVQEPKLPESPGDLEKQTDSEKGPVAPASPEAVPGVEVLPIEVPGSENSEEPTSGKKVPAEPIPGGEQQVGGTPDSAVASEPEADAGVGVQGGGDAVVAGPEVETTNGGVEAPSKAPVAADLQSPTADSAPKKDTEEHVPQATTGEVPGKDVEQTPEDAPENDLGQPENPGTVVEPATDLSGGADTDLAQPQLETAEGLKADQERAGEPKAGVETGPDKKEVEAVVTEESAHAPGTPEQTAAVDTEVKQEGEAATEGVQDGQDRELTAQESEA